MQILTKGPSLRKEVCCDLRSLWCLNPLGWMICIQVYWTTCMLKLGQSPFIQPISSWHTLSGSLHLMTSYTRASTASAISSAFQERVPQNCVNKRHYVSSTEAAGHWQNICCLQQTYSSHLHCKYRIHTAPVRLVKEPRIGIVSLLWFPDKGLCLFRIVLKQNSSQARHHMELE